MLKRHQRRCQVRDKNKQNVKFKSDSKALEVNKSDNSSTLDAISAQAFDQTDKSFNLQLQQQQQLKQQLEQQHQQQLQQQLKLQLQAQEVEKKKKGKEEDICFICHRGARTGYQSVGAQGNYMCHTCESYSLNQDDDSDSGRYFYQLEKEEYDAW